MIGEWKIKCHLVHFCYCEQIPVLRDQYAIGWAWQVTNIFVWFIQIYFRMDIRVILTYLATIFIGITLATTSLVPAREEVIIPKTCTMDRVFKMVGYDCTNMNLKEIPQHLRTNLQVSFAPAFSYYNIFSLHTKFIFKSVFLENSPFESFLSCSSLC